MPVTWDCVLCRHIDVKVDLSSYSATDLKKIARFWVGKDATKFAKAACIKTLQDVFKNPKTVDNAVENLSDSERKVLGIYSRLGPTVSGALIAAELLARGLIEPPTTPKPGEYRSYYREEKNDLVSKLRDKLLLVTERGYYAYGYYSSFYSRPYPELTLHPKLWGKIPAAPPVVWKPSEKTPPVVSDGFRRPAEVALEFWQVAEALGRMGSWKTLKGGGLAKPSQNQLHKLLQWPTVEEQPLVPPDYEGIYYELLHEMEFLDPRSSQVFTKQIEGFLADPPAIQGQNWIQEWMTCTLWQDGIGLVSDRYNEREPTRINPNDLTKARELLAWALCAIAHSSEDWLDLEIFLCDLWRITRKDQIDFYWNGYAWRPKLVGTHGKEKLQDEARKLAYWLDDEGTCLANALWVTLWTLGMIERGHSEGKSARLCFRLTELGREVFGAPEIELRKATGLTPCLTVQPNCDIAAYLDAAEARQIATLARFADRTSAQGQVQIFKLGRESVYRGLESGLSAEKIQKFLAENSKSPVPDNVQKLLAEWAGKRESLVLRTGISLAISPKPTDLPKTGRAVSELFTLLPAIKPKEAETEFKGWVIQNHVGPLAKAWKADELGHVQKSGQDSLSDARLALLAEGSNSDWQITESSVTHAKTKGLSPDQMLAWLSAHLSHSTPPLLETAIRSWTGRASVFLGQLPMLQVTRPQARDAILTSPAFRPLLAGHIPPDWFLVQPDQLAELKRLLEQIGLTPTETYQLPVPGTSSKPIPVVVPKKKARKRRI